MPDAAPDVVVAGHICLDLIPELPNPGPGASLVPPPGGLAVVGPVVTSTGGCVSNTGLALHKLGVGTTLMGKVGGDLLGRATLDFIRSHGESLAEGMIVAENESSSYTVVLNPPNVDRSFLHFPGPNDSFVANDVDYGVVSQGRLFHFGYPPLMRSMFAEDGRELEELFKRSKAAGVTTSLDLAQPDPQSPAGKADWRAILKRALPYVDIFLPSFDEILYMLAPERAASTESSQAGCGQMSYRICSELADKLIDMGAAVVCLKLGEHGLYLRSTRDIERLGAMGKCSPPNAIDWVNRELAAPCFDVKVAGTTGSGDCTIAGFLAAWTRGLGPSETINTAVAVGACNVEEKDATSGVKSWQETVCRMKSGWSRAVKPIARTGWHWDGEASIWAGPRDASMARRKAAEV